MESEILNNKNEIYSTLDNVEIRDGRCQGNTTRQCNQSVELFLQWKTIKIQDHYENGSNKKANEYLLNMIKERLFRVPGHNITWTIKYIDKFTIQRGIYRKVLRNKK